jgi:adenosylcobinamide-GDP ribazoletransferase
MKSFFAAIRFLTIIPVPGKIGTGESDLAGSLAMFPLVGLLIGALTGGIFCLVGPYLPQAVMAVLAVTLLLGFSGGLHLDGVADCADGFFSSRPREQMLEIMRDSRIGTMGVVALFLVLSLKVAALISVPKEEIWSMLILMPIAGRCSLPLMMAVLPYARPEGGLAAAFYERGAVLEAVWAAGLLMLSCWLLAGIIGLMIAPLVIVVVLLFCLYCKKMIGGATGDTLGADCEISEAVSAVCYVSLISLLQAG